MKMSRAIAIVMLGITLAALPALAAEPAAKADPKPIKAKVLATVGKTEITEDQVNAVLARQPGLTPEQVEMNRERLVGQMIQQELMEAYLKTAPCPQDKLAAEKKRLTDQLKQYEMTMKDLLERQGMTEAELNTRMRMMVAMRTLQDQAMSKEKIEALVKSAPPAYFDGTKLEASHILIMSPPYASQADKAKARAKLAGIARQIADGTIKFEAAAKKHSACPSSEKGGALGEFTFDRMDPAFSKAAFALKGDEVSGIVESSFGFHLIKVTKREKGTGKAGDNAKEQAGRMLMAALQADIIRQAAVANPVVIKN